MITDFIVSAFLAGIDAITSLFPSWTIPTPTGGTAGAFDFLFQLNEVFPIFVLINVLLLLVFLRVMIGGFSVAVWVYHQFWGSA